MTSPNQDRHPNTLWPEPIQFHAIDLSGTEIDPDKHPIIAEINLLAGLLLETLGPAFWAALILLSLWAELSPG
ncbi:MAG: hypothetical protein ACREFB_04300 [Stellaceae bacterium]